MNKTNRMGLMAVGVTVIVLLGGYAIYWATSSLLITKSSPTSPTASPVATLAPITDKDADGLSDLVENLYKTNPDKADTDSDGTKDGEEVAAGRDPAKAGPSDRLSDVPLGGNVLDTTTYTGRYLASLPADIARDQILDKVRMEAFVEEHKGELLPSMAADTVKTSSATGKEAVKTYLDQISASTNPALKLVTSSSIEAAFRAAYADPKNTALHDAKVTLEGNFKILQATPAPLEAKDLHTKLLAATQGLMNNVALLENMPKDFVGGLIGAKNIQLLGEVFNDIGVQVKALEEKYDIT